MRELYVERKPGRGGGGVGDEGLGYHMASLRGGATNYGRMGTRVLKKNVSCDRDM